MANEINITAGVKGDLSPLEAQIRQLEARGINFKAINSQPLGRLTGQVAEFDKSMAAANARVIAFGASAGLISVVSAALSNLVRQSIDVEKQLTDINSVLGESAEGLKAFGSALFDIAKNTGSSFTQVASAAKELARQGLSVQDTLARTNDALVLARLSGLDAAKAVETLTATINSFNKEAITSAEIVNRLANVDANFAVSAGDLAEGISRSGAVAQDAKVSLNELIAVITTVQQRTARGGAVIGEAFKTIFTRLERSDTLDKLSDLGIAVKDVEGKTLPAIQILTQLAQTFDTLGDAQKASVGELVGGVRQINTLKAALSDINSKYSIYRQALEVANNTTDEATQRNDALNKTLSALANESLANFTKLSAAAGKLVFGPSLEKIFGGFNSLANNFDGNGIGSKIGEGILKGIGNAISGPGLVLGGFLAAKLFGTFLKFASDSTQRVLGIGQATEKQRNIQEGINQLLARNPQLYDQILSKARSLAEQETLILEIIQKQVAANRARQAFSSSISSVLSNKGVRYNDSEFQIPTTKSAGYVPNLGGILTEIEGAKREGYHISAGDVRSMNATINGKPTEVVYNTREQVIPNYAGTGEPAIIPPNKTIADVMRARNASQGFIPNLAARINQINAEGRYTMIVPRPYNEVPSEAHQTVSYGGKSYGVDFPIRGYKSRYKISKIQNDVEDAMLRITKDYAAKLNLPNQITELTNKGSIVAAAGTVFESTLQGYLTKNQRNSSSTAPIDFPNPTQELRDLFGGAQGGFESKSGVSPRNLKSMADKVVRLSAPARSFAEGYVPNFAASLYTNELGGNPFGFGDLSGVPTIQAPNVGVLTTGLQGYALNPVIPASLRKLKKRFEADPEISAYLDAFGKKYFSEGIATQVGGVFGINPNGHILSSGAAGGFELENLLVGSYGIAKPSGSQRPDIKGGDVDKIRAQGGAHIPLSINELEIKLSAYELSKKGKIKEPSSSMSAIVANSLKSNINILGQLVPRPEFEEFLRFKPFNSQGSVRDILKDKYGLSAAAGNVPNPYSLRLAGISREEQKIIGRLISGWGGEGLMGSAETLRGTDEVAKARIRKNYSNHTAFEGRNLSEEQKGIILDKALKTLYILKQGMNHPNTGRVGAHLQASGGYVPNLAKQITASEVLQSGVDKQVPGLKDAIYREVTGTGVSIDQARVNFLDENSGLPAISVTNTRDEGANADPRIGFNRVKSRGGRIDLAGSGNEYARGFVPNLADERTSADAQKDLSVLKFNLEKASKSVIDMNMGRILALEKEIETLKAREVAIEREKISVSDKIRLSQEKQLHAEQEVENKKQAQSQKLQRIGFFAAFGVPLLGGAVAEGIQSQDPNKLERAQTARGVTGVTNAIGTGLSIGSVGGPYGAILGAVIGAGLGLKSVFEALTPSVEELQKKADALASAQNGATNSARNFLQAQSRVQELILSNASKSEIKKAQEQQFSAFANISSPELKRSFISNLNNPDAQEEIVSQQEAENKRLQALQQVTVNAKKASDSQPGFLGYYGAEIGIGDYENNVSDTDLNLSVSDILKGKNGNNPKSGSVGILRNYLKSGSYGENYEEKQKYVLDRLGVNEEQASQITRGYSRADSDKIIEKLFKAAEDKNNFTESAKKVEAFTFSIRKFNTSLEAGAALTARITALRNAALTQKFEVGIAGLEGVNRLNEPFTSDVGKARQNFQTDQFKTQFEASKSLLEIQQELRPKIASLAEIVGGGNIKTGQRSTEDDNFQKLLTKSLDPNADQTSILKSLLELVKDDTALSTEGKNLQKNLRDLQQNASAKVDAIAQNTSKANELAQQTLNQALTKAGLDRLLSTTANIFEAGGTSNAKSQLGSDTYNSLSYQYSDSNELRNLRDRRTANLGGGSYGAALFDKDNLAQVAEQQRIIVEGIQDKIAKGYIPTNVDLEGTSGTNRTSLQSLQDRSRNQISNASENLQRSQLLGYLGSDTDSLIATLKKGFTGSTGQTISDETIRRLQKEAARGDTASLTAEVTNLQRTAPKSIQDALQNYKEGLAGYNQQSTKIKQAAQVDAEKILPTDKGIISNTQDVAKIGEVLAELEKDSRSKSTDLTDALDKARKQIDVLSAELIKLSKNLAETTNRKKEGDEISGTLKVDATVRTEGTPTDVSNQIVEDIKKQIGTLQDQVKEIAKQNKNVLPPTAPPTPTPTPAPAQ